MKQKLHFFKDKLGIDGAIAFSSISRLIQGLGGVVSVILVASLLNEIEQGFYYTFASILAIQVFFELGLNGIITQYVAHEVSYLKQVGNHYVGNENNLSRLGSLLHFTVKWFSILSLLVLLLLLIAGYVFFNYFYKSDVVVNWHLPWILLSIGTALNFMLSPIIAFIEGLGRVRETSKMRMFQQIIGLLVIWSGLALGLKLYVGGISTLFGFIILLYFILKTHLPSLKNLYHQKITCKVSYKTEIFPLQWKIALSWIGGYFIFQLFNPVLFATEGPVIAGQMGITLSILNAILALSFTWVSTKTPVFSSYIAQRDFEKLDSLFNLTFIQSSVVNFFALVCLFFAVFCIRHFEVVVTGKLLGNRFLAYLPMLLMILSFFMNHLIAAWAFYLRCHKKEPMLVHSLFFGVFSSISTLVLGRYYGLLGITSGYFLISLFATIWAYQIFQKKKKTWHL